MCIFLALIVLSVIQVAQLAMEDSQLIVLVALQGPIILQRLNHAQLVAAQAFIFQAQTAIIVIRPVNHVVLEALLDA